MLVKFYKVLCKKKYKIMDICKFISEALAFSAIVFIKCKYAFQPVDKIINKFCLEAKKKNQSQRGLAD